MKSLALILALILAAPATAGFRFLHRRNPHPRPAKRRETRNPPGTATAPLPPNTGLRRIEPEHRECQQDTFMAYQNALNAWHAFGQGEDDLYHAYRKLEQVYIEDATRKFGSSATATRSAELAGQESVER